MDDSRREVLYWERLRAIAAEHGEQIARMFRLRPGYLEADELAIVLNFALGRTLDPLHTEDAPLAAEAVLEGLTALPPESCHPRTAVDALVWYDRGASQGRRVPTVVAQGALFQPSIEQAFRDRRRERTGHSMRCLVENQRELARAVDGLVDALGEPGGNQASRSALRANMKRIQSLLRSSEWHARAAAAWAVKNGFAMDGISQALFRLLLRPLRRMGRLMTALETHLDIPQDQRCSPRINRVSRRVLLELMDAAAIECELEASGCIPAGSSTG
ncbi:hypothetical protein [Aquisalimonas sp.]|uniref:hypothetical protein n=1 Tax=unclassified Aquisalimonas TaxID=2644645 RepID=UPI0025BCF05E|nr:hypothetical protein [Aquisalimonas sp.]